MEQVYHVSHIPFLLNNLGKSGFREPECVQALVSGQNLKHLMPAYLITPQDKFPTLPLV